MSVVDKQLYLASVLMKKPWYGQPESFNFMNWSTYILFLHNIVLCGMWQKDCISVSCCNAKESPKNHFCLILGNKFSIRLGKIILFLNLAHFFFWFSAALQLLQLSQAISSSEWVDKQLSYFLLQETGASRTETESKCQILSPFGYIFIVVKVPHTATDCVYCSNVLTHQEEPFIVLSPTSHLLHVSQHFINPTFIVIPWCCAINRS